ncbi:unannotated protein [freshwater metagenome]|uniref:Unannotated protein n=1 Tax=freshwater metagenome TaxID=449393 RepID=A0A6J6UKC2_9ZZZZ
MISPKHSKIFALALTSFLLTGTLSTLNAAQANTLKKISISKAGRVVTPGINTLLSGKGAPKSAVGINGDFYIDTNTMNIYGPKAKGKWPAAVSLKGTAGTNGTNGSNGSTGSTGATGAKGVATNGIDGATGATGASGSSGSGSSGAAGATGATGPAGPTGTPGSTGAQGPIGTTGNAGPTGGQGTIGNTGPAGATGPAGSNEVAVYNLTVVGGTTQWFLSSGIPTSLFSNPFGNLQPNTKYRFTIIVNGVTNWSGFADLSVGSVVALSGAGSTLDYSTHYGFGNNTNAEFALTFNFSFLHEGTVVVGSNVSSLNVSVIDGTGWSELLSKTHVFYMNATAYVQIA